MVHTIIRGISPERKAKFKIKCLESEYTMQRAMAWFFEEIIAGRIKLPKKE